jgi:hypothetical protein
VNAPKPQIDNASNPDLPMAQEEVIAAVVEAVIALQAGGWAASCPEEVQKHPFGLSW